MGRDDDLWGSSDLHVGGGRVVPMQSYRVHAGGNRVPGRADGHDMRGGRERLPLRRVDDDMHRARVVRRRVAEGGLLHQRVHGRNESVRDGRRRDVRDAIQWMHGMGKCDAMPRGDAELQRRGVRHAAELPGQRHGYDELWGEQRELLHEPASDGRDV
jgi:hypothetical protein